jgi:hypothetical protein
MYTVVEVIIAYHTLKDLELKPAAASIVVRVIVLRLVLQTIYL